MPSICIVIVNYNSSKLTCRCISSIREHIGTELDIVVVDNSPANELPYILEKHPAVVTIRTSRNIGFAGGCNLGIKYALDKKNDYIQLLNPDTRIEHNFISCLVKIMEEDEALALAGPKILRDNVARGVWFGGGRINWWKGGPSQIFDDRNDGKGDVQIVPVLSGCAMMLRGAAVVKVGNMTEDYFLYFEDTDYVQRFLRAGYKAAYVPKAEVLHSASTTVGFQSEMYVYYFSRNRIWFMRRWAKWYHYLVFMLYNTVVKLPGVIIVFGLRRRNVALVKAYLKGYCHGLRRMIHS